MYDRGVGLIVVIFNIGLNTNYRVSVKLLTTHRVELHLTSSLYYTGALMNWERKGSGLGWMEPQLKNNWDLEECGGTAIDISEAIIL